MKHVSIPLRDSLWYDLSISLEGVSYTIELMYNPVMQMYTISLYDDRGSPIILEEALVPNYPIFLDYNLPNMSGAFFLFPKEVVRDTEPYKRYPDQIHKYYNFYYVYIEE